ncbi:N-acyl-phosphatidylethanolamine-hydrolyzing phospholipase D [Porphyridium purpureum]|uniref:N-acyl-phosphatidylethanolamine-hydrolyzing phospholipase D n=1 Tax=Porphyridium purpureum TaxID=35688 RepID=A0A5J4Z9V7_PORPP|nr:N-acyl-phosphatidylethanolamine-hydrolyzing phospholipase D [Porphyridium purpureum]|eukprot:POR4436..scf295_1
MLRGALRASSRSEAPLLSVSVCGPLTASAVAAACGFWTRVCSRWSRGSAASGCRTSGRSHFSWRRMRTMTDDRGVPSRTEVGSAAAFGVATPAEAQQCGPPGKGRVESSADRAAGNMAAVATTQAQIEKVQPLRLKNGKYWNPWSSWTGLPTLVDFIKLWWNERGKWIYTDEIPEEYERHLPVKTPDLEVLCTAPKPGVLRSTWLGHSTVLVQFEQGFTVITDPVFSERCSPVQWFGVKRYRPAPCTAAQLPHIDAVLISHNHYDHLDLLSVRAIETKFSPAFYVPQGLKSWLVKNVPGLDSQRVHELGWWEETFQRKNDKEFKIVFTPAQHWGSRALLDNCRALWGSWVVAGPTKKFFFAGDSGYCPVFTSVGALYGPFDLSAIPIGAYEPHYFFRQQHVNPEEAVQMHVDLRSRRSLGIHWGTFKLTMEHYMEPRERMLSASGKAGLEKNAFFTLTHGEHLDVE